MDPEDGVIWVYGLGDESVMAFTDFGIETLVELIKVLTTKCPARAALISAASAGPCGPPL